MLFARVVILPLLLFWPAAHAFELPAFQAAQAGLSIDEREARLTAALRELQAQAPQPELRGWLESLQSYRSEIRQPHPDHPALSVPQYPIAALATVVLREWDLHAALSRSKALAPDSSTARARWIARSPESALHRFIAQSALTDEPELVLQALLRRLPNPPVAVALASSGEQAASFHLLADWLSTATDAGQRAQVIRAGLANSALQSAFARHHADPQQAWIRLQAAALNRTDLITVLRAPPPGLLRLLEIRLADSAQAALAAWGLWQLRSPAALAALQRYRQADNGIPHIQSELTRWLD